MKEKILLFVIGVLVGAVIATGAFYIYSKNTNNCSSNNTQMNGGQPPEMPNEQNGQPPEMPNGQGGQPPQKPEENNN